MFLNAATCEPKYHVHPTKRFIRAGRQKLRTVLTCGLDIQYEKKLKSFSTEGTEVTAHFTDGTAFEGSLLIGADGANSMVRAGMKMKTTQLNPLPINLIGAVRHFTPEQAVHVRALNPLLFFALHPDTKTFLFYSIQVGYNVHQLQSHADEFVGSGERPRWSKFLRCSCWSELDDRRRTRCRSNNITRTGCFDEETGPRIR